jgi:DNA-binding Lrp family transcriptional regulator
MPLSSDERLILSACEMQADLTIPEIARRAGVAEHVARRVITKLQDGGAVTRRLYMNSFLLGTTPYLLVFTLNAAGQTAKRELQQYLLDQPQVGFISQVSGSYNIFCEVRAENLLSLRNFLDHLPEKFGGIFLDRQILALTSMNDFPVMGSLQAREGSKEFATELVPHSVSVGKLDTALLQALGRKWEDSSLALARLLGQPASTVDYHLKKLRSEGIIIGARYFVNLLGIGRHFFYHLVSTRGFHPVVRQRLLEFARSETCCNTFRTFLGPWDVLFECHYESASESLAFVERLLAKYDSVIAKVETLSVLAHTKGSDCTVATTQT